MKKKILICLLVILLIGIVTFVIIKLNKDSNNDEYDDVKSAFNKFEKALANKDAKEMLSCIDCKGVVAWKRGFDSDDFSSSDYEDFIEEYKDVDREESNEVKETINEYYEDFFDNDNEETIYSNGIKKKLGKDLYSITVEWSEGGEGWGTGVGKRTFILYKGKVIAPFKVLNNY